MNHTTTIQPTELPATIRTYLAAHAVRDADTAIGTFATDAIVVDDGRTYRGIDDILGFLRSAGTQFSYTVELIGAERIDDTHWVAINHLEGDFPGGVVDLRVRFTLDGDRITELVIAP